MQSRYDEIKALDAEVLGISADTPTENQDFSQAAKIEFPLLSDQDGQAMDAFGLRHSGASLDGGDIARPAVFLVDREGKIAWRMLTPNLRVRVRPETVVAQLAQMH
ncbi:MAG: redoxin domain-containing protein [Planctomycetales bacterium]|nr:redoxin domain-containing protein [Planctomycetales bacterium]NIM10210.1 redoxin domain-containing protein [Planctomycetales bacterium]NIN09627.1 redoxin domain-containing protein [Planctomycetales bacterium]NIN78753.1 redoxin domain-containing protein [Planctomycetales bacterium]NIO35927.1 redoxin domain-containing protein [Planctomycetales bacterium]